MRKLVRTTIAIAALAAANPLFAQDVDSDESASSTPERMEEFAGLMAGLFQTEPLTSEQQSRLPMAEAVVGQMMPEGFYGKMMGDMMDKMVRPMVSMFATPEFILGSRLEVEQEAIAQLGEAEQVEILSMLDPAYDQRVDVISDVLTGEVRTLRSDVLFDVGQSMNPGIDIGQIEGAFALVAQMESVGLVPNVVTYTSLIDACAKAPGRLPLAWARPGGHPRLCRRRRGACACVCVACGVRSQHLLSSGAHRSEATAARSS